MAGDFVYNNLRQFYIVKRWSHCCGRHCFNKERINILYAIFPYLLTNNSQVFPAIYSRKAICQALWGEFYYNRSKGKIFTTSRNGELQPMFAQYVLGRVWRMYAKLQEGNITAAAGVLKLDKAVVAEMQKKGPSRLRKGKKKSVEHDKDKDIKYTAQHLCKRWLPVSEAILTMACACLPCPRNAQRERIECIIPLASVDAACAKGNSAQKTAVGDVAKLRSKLLTLRSNIECCSVSDDTKTQPSPPIDTVAFVTKMFAVHVDTIALHDRVGMAITGGHCFLAFARVFSGTLRRDSPMFVLGAKYHPMQAQPIEPVSGLKLFVMMGRELRGVDQVPAGNVVAIGGLQTHVLRFATLCSSRSCISLAHISMQVVVVLQIITALFVRACVHRDGRQSFQC